MTQEKTTPVAMESPIISLEEVEARKIAGEGIAKMEKGESFVFPFSKFLEQMLRMMKLK